VLARRVRRTTSQALLPLGPPPQIVAPDLKAVADAIARFKSPGYFLGCLERHPSVHTSVHVPPCVHGNAFRISHHRSHVTSRPWRDSPGGAPMQEVQGPGFGTR